MIRGQSQSACEDPEDSDTEKLVATFKSGVLEIHAPKAVEAKPRKVTIAPV